MATYECEGYLVKLEDAAFKNEHKPGGAAPFSGIYRCMGCGSEVASNEHQPLPPQNHHQHQQNQGEIRWKLIVYADHRAK